MSTPLESPLTEAATADAVAAAVAACPAVAALHPGGIAHRAVTYLPGRRVEGVRVLDDRVAIAVVGVQGIPVAVLAQQVRSAVAPLVPGRAVDVHVADLSPFEQQPAALPAAPTT